MCLAWKFYRGFHVPVLVNAAPINPKTKLVRYVQKELRVPLANVAKVTTVKAVPEAPPLGRRQEAPLGQSDEASGYVFEALCL